MSGESTHVGRLTPLEGRRLYEELGQGAYAFRSVPYAHWSAKGEGVTATFYRSGKLVVQGTGLPEFLRRYLGTEAAAPAAVPVHEDEAVECVTAGSDESGKGDYFGPLAVAACLVRPEDVTLLRELGVVDSKLASAQRIQAAEGFLCQALPHALRVLSPEDYNREWAKVGNVNVLLGRLHAEVLEEVVACAPDASKVRIVVDQFGDASHVTRALGPMGRRASFTMRPGGESNPAVAAASFLARAAFLRGFAEAAALSGDERLPRGASDPRIVPTARRLLREGGEAWLGKLAKLHFRVTELARR
jgi:ribonuclease HIII